MSDQLNVSIDIRLCNSMSFLTFPNNMLLLPSCFQIWCTIIHAITRPFFPSPAFWNIFQYLMFKKSLGFRRICLFLLNKKKYNIWGKQTEILVTDTVLVLSLQTRIQNIFLFFLDVFFRAIHSIYGYGKYLTIFLPNTELVCKSYHHLPESQYLKQHLFFFVCVQCIFKRFVSRY